MNCVEQYIEYISVKSMPISGIANLEKFALHLAFLRVMANNKDMSVYLADEDKTIRSLAELRYQEIENENRG